MAEINHRQADRIIDEKTRDGFETTAAAEQQNLTHQSASALDNLCLVTNDDDILFSPFNEEEKIITKKRKVPLKRWRVIKLPIQCAGCQALCNKPLKKRWHGKMDDMYMFDYDSEYLVWYMTTCDPCEWYCGTCYWQYMTSHNKKLEKNVNK